jgi:malonate decarboxylase gamma subunit
MQGDPTMNESTASRGATWLAALTNTADVLAGYPPSVRVADSTLAGEPARYIAVVPDPNSPYPRARTGEVGLIEGWMLARAVHQTIEADHNGVKRAVVAVIDVSSQAYGRREEAFGIHQALAGAAGAYAQARQLGHPVIGLIVGKAMSGAFLAHGYQANRLIALKDDGVMVHAMGKEAAARVTLRSVEDLERLAAEVPPMAYDIASYATLGLLWKLVDVRSAEQPAASDVAAVRSALVAALHNIRRDLVRDLRSRLGGENRSASSLVREKLRAQW